MYRKRRREGGRGGATGNWYLQYPNIWQQHSPPFSLPPSSLSSMAIKTKIQYLYPVHFSCKTCIQKNLPFPTSIYPLFVDAQLVQSQNHSHFLSPIYPSTDSTGTTSPSGTSPRPLPRQRRKWCNANGEHFEEWLQVTCGGRGLV